MSNLTANTPARPTQDLTLQIFFAMLTLWIVIFAAHMLENSMHWPLVHDAPILIYMNFLKDHGMRLYRDVIEVQFPGSLMLYAFGRAVFGTTDLGFRLFDLLGLFVIFLSMLVVVGKRASWFAAVFAIAFFLTLHTGTPESISDLGQRDFFLTAFLGIASACSMEAIRRHQPALLAIFGFSIAFGASIKPTAAIFILLLGPALLEAQKKRERTLPLLLWCSAGIACGVICVLGFLVKNHALTSFLQLERELMPLYSALAYKGFVKMLPGLAWPSARLLLPMLLGAAWLVAAQRSLWRQREQQILLLGICCGATSYFLQHKGFSYHRYPFFFFAYLWMGWVFVSAARQTNFLRWPAVIVLLLATAALPHFIRLAHPSGWDDILQNDLETLHAFDSPRQIQCLDITEGCTTALLRTNTIEATGYITDYLFFLDSHDPRLERLRESFLQHLQQASPRLIVIPDNQWPVLDVPGYGKLAYWPAFVSYLNDRYVLRLERVATPQQTHGYRIYERKNQLSLP